MSGNPTCQKCGEIITEFEVFSLEGHEKYRPTKIQALAFACPHCQVVISVAVDPGAHRAVR